MRSGTGVKNWALSVDQCLLEALQFSVHLIDLLSILLRYNGFTRIQKAVVDHTSSRPSNSDHDLFFIQVWCWERLKVGSEGHDRRWDGWMASPTQWIWVWVHSRSWWWTGRPGMLQSMGLQRVGHGWATELNLECLLGPTIELVIAGCIKSTFCHMSQSNWEIIPCCCTQ